MALAPPTKVDVEVCARCGGKARILGFVTGPRVVRRILAHLERRASEGEQAWARSGVAGARRELAEASSGWWERCRGAP